MSLRTLLLMDYQVGICGEGGLLGTRSGLSAHASERNVLEKAGRVLQWAREQGVPVVHVGVAFEENYGNRTNRSPAFERFESNRWLLRSSTEAAFNPEVRPVPGEPVVFKGCVDPFVGTNLLQILIRLGSTDLYLGGTATNYVVESAARHAGDMGFSVTVLEDLCASYNQEMHEFSVARVLPTFATIGDSVAFMTVPDGDPA